MLACLIDNSRNLTRTYQSVYNYIDTGEKIPPTLPLPKGGIPLFEKEGPFDGAHGHELDEWLGEILKGYIWSIIDSLVSA